ncbi:hypothetical protein C3077_22020 [Salmonella enterica]|nr:hypothetical protein [Salmonella enterica]EDG3219359.1 hypothetical protein [Salmonella enterica subsp. enterica serovar Infantis]EJR7219287.1 hypothetical protein [Salmonella enterica subsp. enterica serovar Kentucky]HEJ9060781.1 hypothetical protein [Serratia fonticola]EBI1134270.1 hypothetical protein [Salmonella enterica]
MKTYMTKRELTLHSYLLNNLHVLLELTQYQMDTTNFFIKIEEVKDIAAKIKVLKKSGLIEYDGCDIGIYQLEHNIFKITVPHWNFNISNHGLITLYILSKDYDFITDQFLSIEEERDIMENVFKEIPELSAPKKRNRL